MMVEFSGMSDKESQQRRGRADGAVWSVADRIAVEENRALAPESAQESPWWPPVDRQPRCPGRDSVDSAERCSLAGLARGVSASLDLLATAAGLGGAGRGCGAGVDFSAEGGDRVRTAARALRGMRGRTEEKGTRWKAERCGR